MNLKPLQMNKNKCDKGCCTILIKPYNNKINIDYTNKKRRYKAGIFIFDPQTEKVLLVQSKGNLWGPPKGGMQENETECMCAMRELREETGINIILEPNCRFTKIQNKAIYFYVERPECEIQIQDTVPDNDANAVTWITLSCLEHYITNGAIELTKHCIIAFSRFLNKNFENTY